ncbi:hypothetical protein NLI96_g12044 [Meripilus lineatus]|uniref:Uncharacterized protein n=1 Tax=Meripilus lineatus TaxID=2056292 RepID=A0AAD5UQT7_9APHY|nr:hypothetical protein NLI96_g12044 [Physisporinus lineatus]
MEGVPWLSPFRIRSILISRFILDLRSVQISDNQTGSGSVSSVRFTARATGTLGAPLDQSSTWATNAVDNIPEPMIYSDDPLAEGLIPHPEIEEDSQNGVEDIGDIL